MKKKFKQKSSFPLAVRPLLCWGRKNYHVSHYIPLVFLFQIKECKMTEDGKIDYESFAKLLGGGGAAQ